MRPKLRSGVLLASLLSLPAWSVVAPDPPVAVSPGSAARAVQIAARCPTFSWTEVPAAVQYELVIYEVGDADGEAVEVLRQTVPGGATTWTPSLERCLGRAGRYAWSVRTVGGEAETDWSAPSLFEVVSGPVASQFEEATEAQAFLAARNDREIARRRGPVPQFETSPGVSAEAAERQAALSVPPSLVLTDGGIEFPDGSVQETAYRLGAPVPKTGQTESEAVGDDGDLERGVTWPNPRFTPTGDGTVKDNLTELIWLQDANCIYSWYPEFDADEVPGDGRVWWQHALDFVAGMNTGLYGNCAAGQSDWRLPNVRELQSLIDYGRFNPALPTGHPFWNVVPSYCWSSTTAPFNINIAFVVNLNFGDVVYSRKTGDYAWYAWPVRGGQ